MTNNLLKKTLLSTLCVSVMMSSVSVYTVDAFAANSNTLTEAREILSNSPSVKARAKTKDPKISAKNQKIIQKAEEIKSQGGTTQALSDERKKEIIANSASVQARKQATELATTSGKNQVKVSQAKEDYVQVAEQAKSDAILKEIYATTSAGAAESQAKAYEKEAKDLAAKAEKANSQAKGMKMAQDGLNLSD